MLHDPIKRQQIIRLYHELQNKDDVAAAVDGVSRREVRDLLSGITLQQEVKVLNIDIETSLNTAGCFAFWKQNIPLASLTEHWRMLSFAYSWTTDPENVTGFALTDFIGECEEVGTKWWQDDMFLTGKVYDILNEADIIIAQNGDRFDIPKINTRLLLNGFQPPSPYQSVDTLKVLKRHFAFGSNKLDFVSKRLGHGGKLKTDIDLWVACQEGDTAAFQEMLTYNKEDVVQLWKVYQDLRPWITSHPNLAAIYPSEISHCPACYSPDIAETGEFYPTGVSRFPVLRCGECGHVARGRVSVLTKEQRDNLLVSRAR